MKIIFDPRNRMRYASYYISGIIELFGRRNTSYSLRPFSDLDRWNEADSFEQYMAFVMIDGDVTKRYIIDYRDKTEIKEMAYNWCDVYAKINISLEQDMKEMPKLISIPPGFGIRPYSPFSLQVLCVVNYLKCRCKPLRGLRQHIRDYRLLYKAFVPIEVYEHPVDEKPDYVFHASSLWGHAVCANTTNPLRLAFMKACRNSEGVCFEGGFVSNSDLPEQYADFILRNRYKTSQYLQKVQQSVMVFNTPAVHGCHGWKLGEYLAMGKVIISTPISNRLPAPLVDQVNILQVTTPDEMMSVVERIMADKDKMRQIRENNRDYYQRYVKPSSVIRNILASGIHKS